MSAATFSKEPPLPPIGQTASFRAAADSQTTADLAQRTLLDGTNSSQPSQSFSVFSNAAAASASIAGGLAGLDDPSLTGKLVHVEAQRIMSVLQEAQRKILIIGMLPDEVDRRVSTVFAAETVALIGEYKLLETKYKSLVDAKAPEAETKEVAKQLRMSTRTVCRHFLQNPHLVAKLRVLKSTKPGHAAAFEALLQEVKLLVYERLKTSVEEEQARLDQLSVIVAKEQKTSNEVRLLKEELEKAKKERSTEVSKRNEAIRKLKDELREIKQQAEDTTKRLESRSKQKEDQELQQAKDKEVSLRHEIETYTQNLADMIKKNREEEALLRKKKFKVESEVENWIHKYDQDMEEKQAELEDITTIYNEEKAQLDELQTRYNDLQKEYDRIMEERRVQQENRIAEEKRLKVMHLCATKIQAVFRGWKLRRDLAKKKAGGGGGGGKGSKKGTAKDKKKK